MQHGTRLPQTRPAAANPGGSYRRTGRSCSLRRTARRGSAVSPQGCRSRNPRPQGGDPFGRNDAIAGHAHAFRYRPGRTTAAARHRHRPRLRRGGPERARAPRLRGQPHRRVRISMPSAAFLYVNPTPRSCRENDHSAPVTPRSAKSRAASSAMVMSGSASTAAIR